jgi:hypothetical protein
MEANDPKQGTPRRRVWTILQRGGKLMKFEVGLENPKITQMQETISRLRSECPELEISERDE